VYLNKLQRFRYSNILDYLMDLVKISGVAQRHVYYLKI